VCRIVSSFAELFASVSGDRRMLIRAAGNETEVVLFLYLDVISVFVLLRPINACV